MKNNNNKKKKKPIIISVDYAHRHKFNLDKQILAYILLDKTNDQPDMNEIETTNEIVFKLRYIYH